MLSLFPSAVWPHHLLCFGPNAYFFFLCGFLPWLSFLFCMVTFSCYANLTTSALSHWSLLFVWKKLFMSPFLFMPLSSFWNYANADLYKKALSQNQCEYFMHWKYFSDLPAKSVVHFHWMNLRIYFSNWFFRCFGSE